MLCASQQKRPEKKAEQKILSVTRAEEFGAEDKLAGILARADCWIMEEDSQLETAATPDISTVFTLLLLLLALDFIFPPIATPNWCEISLFSIDETKNKILILANIIYYPISDGDVNNSQDSDEGGATQSALKSHQNSLKFDHFRSIYRRDFPFFSGELQD